MSLSLLAGRAVATCTHRAPIEFSDQTVIDRITRRITGRYVLSLLLENVGLNLF